MFGAKKHKRCRRHGLIASIRVRRTAGSGSVTLTIDTQNIPCVLGSSGMMKRKREGDGATPTGRFRMLYGYCRGDRGWHLKTDLPLRSLRADSGWCDDPASGCYNRAVKLPFGRGHERMWREDRLYDVVIVLNHNTRPHVRGHGSAIFMHIMHPTGTPTAGCVAIAPDDMRRLLPRLSARTVLIIG